MPMPLFGEPSSCVVIRLPMICVNSTIMPMGRGRNVGVRRVVRGGSWNDNARNVRAAYRNHKQPDERNNNLGFRCSRAHDRMDFRI